MSVERDVIPKAAREKSIPYFFQIPVNSFLYFLFTSAKESMFSCPFVGPNGTYKFSRFL